MADGKARTDFFISYTEADQGWAEWIAWQLEQDGYTTIIQAWDFQAGGNFVDDMDRATKLAEHTIALLSPNYFQSRFTCPEWQAAFRRDPTSEQGVLLPVRVRACDVEGLLGAIVYIDLVGKDEKAARHALLRGVSLERAKPATAPPFPVTTPSSATLPNFPGVLPAIRTVPYPRNPFFTGRDELLSQLHNQLLAGQPQAISGLGGIGKTQLAVEYAYRYCQEYKVVLWASAESQEALTSSYGSIATLLELSVSKVIEQEITIQTIKENIIQEVNKWLQKNSGWLLILDNADEPDQLIDFLPPSRGGHLLVTTRASDLSHLGLGFSHSLVIETFPPEQGTLFLLHRAGLLAQEARLEQAPPQDRALARQVGQELGWLPLALDQAGSYLKMTGSSLTTYLPIYQQHHAQLLGERRGHDHPEPVATTWSLSFRRVEEKNPAAADLLRLLASIPFDIDTILEEAIAQSASNLGPLLRPVAADPFLLNQAIEALRAYSLLNRDPDTHSLSIHRLMQVILTDQMDEPNKHRWIAAALIVSWLQIQIKEYAKERVGSTWESVFRHSQWVERWSVRLLQEQGPVFQKLIQFLLAHVNSAEGLVLAETARERTFVDLLAGRVFRHDMERLAIRPYTLEQIQQVAKQEHATLVEYAFVHDETLDYHEQQRQTLAIWVVSPQGEIVFRQVSLSPLREQQNGSQSDLLEQLDSQTRQALGIPDRDAVHVGRPIQRETVNKALRQLYQLLIAPIEDLLPRDVHEHIVFIPTGPLFFVPFPALQDAEEIPLIEHHTMRIVPSIQVLDIVHQRREQLRHETRGDVLIVGNPTMPWIPVQEGEPPQRLRSLPEAYTEAKVIADLYHVAALSGEQATKSAVVPRMRTAQIIHLATHVFDGFKGLGVPGAIALAPTENDDGLLTVDDLLNLELKAELVVLSASDTGARDRLTGEGVIGLSRAIMSAGVPSIIVSLWDIPDVSTASLMKKMYLQLQHTHDKAQALRQAMLATMKQDPDPRVWAGFMLVGEAL